MDNDERRTELSRNARTQITKKPDAAGETPPSFVWRRIMRDVKEEKPADDRAEATPFERFQKLTRALFRVDKRDVPKHEPTKRAAPVKSQ
jgi:hypothetical protein